MVTGDLSLPVAFRKGTASLRHIQERKLCSLRLLLPHGPRPSGPLPLVLLDRAHVLLLVLTSPSPTCLPCRACVNHLLRPRGFSPVVPESTPF